MRGISCLTEYIFSVLRLCLLFSCALFLPRLFLLYINSTSQSIAHTSNKHFKLGLENISNEFLHSLTPKGDLSYTVGLVTNQTGKDQLGNRNIDILLRKGLHIKKIFTPQHSFYSNIIGNNEISTNVDKITQIPIISVYNTNKSKKIDKKDLDDIDVLIFDIQDTGIRHYSYIDTLLNTMKAAACYNKKVVILDRPNLLGNCIEGSFQSTQDEWESIPIPIRYGMTIGELAQYCNNHILEKPASLHIVPMQSYNRSTEIRKPLIDYLSPNIATIDSCYGYSFLGLLNEVAPFDIGIGTDKAFQCILLPEHIHFPKQKWYELRVMLKNLGVESTFYRRFSRRKKEYYSGLRLLISDINTFSSFTALLAVLDFFKQASISLSFSHNFDKALGTTKVRDFLQGKVDKKNLEHEVNKELRSFFNKAFDSFMYKPFPKVVML